MISTTLTLLLAGLATATPLARRAYPPVSQAQAFTLIANVTDPSKDFFVPPVDHWAFTAVHAGAGISDGMLTPDGGMVLFVNGTAQEVSAGATSILTKPIPVTGGSPIPVGMQYGVGPNDTTSVELVFGFGMPGAGIYPPQRSPYPQAFVPVQGSFMVCNETRQGYPAHPFPVRISTTKAVDSEGRSHYDIPSYCVEITFLAQCAELPPFDGADELNIHVEGVSCYDNVASIDWGKY
ncbi:hypothetical protein GQ53DRAFT_806642 [Thozetella sp. PMI_491]|nr:hypothetical protein GQ53DRAFT_806642 [Thozetella sp. PMI_491]